jgi:hypothetical protein
MKSSQSCFILHGTQDADNSSAHLQKENCENKSISNASKAIIVHATPRASKIPVSQKKKKRGGISFCDNPTISVCMQSNGDQFATENPTTPSAKRSEDNLALVVDAGRTPFLRHVEAVEESPRSAEEPASTFSDRSRLFAETSPLRDVEYGNDDANIKVISDDTQIRSPVMWELSFCAPVECDAFVPRGASTPVTNQAQFPASSGAAAPDANAVIKEFVNVQESVVGGASCVSATRRPLESSPPCLTASLNPGTTNGDAVHLCLTAINSTPTTPQHFGDWISKEYSASATAVVSSFHDVLPSHQSNPGKLQTATFGELEKPGTIFDYGMCNRVGSPTQSCGLSKPARLGGRSKYRGLAASLEPESERCRDTDLLELEPPSAPIRTSTHHDAYVLDTSASYGGPCIRGAIEGDSSDEFLEQAVCGAPTGSDGISLHRPTLCIRNEGSGSGAPMKSDCVPYLMQHRHVSNAIAGEFTMDHQVHDFEIPLDDILHERSSGHPGLQVKPTSDSEERTSIVDRFDEVPVESFGNCLEVSQDIMSCISESVLGKTRGSLRVKEVTVGGAVNHVSIMTMLFKSKNGSRKTFKATLYPMRHEGFPSEETTSGVHCNDDEFGANFRLISVDDGRVTLEFSPTHSGIYTAILVVLCGKKVHQ